ncbi:ABC-type Fe3+-hydroxamate transport system, substrate-binding protein [Roseivivax halotolerans]|uniref:ABC-type Fe3+-hydroxamate transport system, substrate-binding protein n=1 Tax=Roseivivax halotolerans TaxID=93684 RepID=A0A1I6A6E6_9RHOB|nr:ABC transporter substrate-binding protein [Roseivivax halotolerans]SFQ64220.1 ABC-type Fe3+-hydroxamate transport system, substrate-binding protein [Roseivivax halotolerans]
MKPNLTVLAALVAFAATPALAQDCPEGQRLFEHAAGETCIPENPQRIASLHRLTATLTLMDLGAMDRIVASEGHPTEDAYFSDLVSSLLDIDLQDTDITFYGWEVDLERLAALEPDLIIARPWDTEIYDQLGQIAPMISLPIDVDFLDYMGIIADAGGVEAEYDAARAAYEARIETVRLRIPNAPEIEVAVIYADDSEIGLYNNFYALTQVLDDLGFSRRDVVDEAFLGFEGAYDHATSVPISAERIDIIDADILFAAYWYPWTDEKPGRNFIRDNLDAQVPGFCQFLEVCEARQIVYFDAAETYSGSFASLHAAIDLIEQHVANRDLVQVIE